MKYNLLIAFNNAINAVSDFSFETLCQKGLIKTYVDLLKLPESSTSVLEAIIEGLGAMMSEFPEYGGRILSEIERLGGRQKLEELSNHDMEKLRLNATLLLDQFSGDQIVLEK